MSRLQRASIAAPQPDAPLPTRGGSAGSTTTTSVRDAEGPDPSELIAQGRVTLGVELGSTRVKAVLTTTDGRRLAAGSHAWTSRFSHGVWTHDESDIRRALRECYSSVSADCEARFGAAPRKLSALGVSAMMHGYLALDEDDELLVPFRTWRNTSTATSAEHLSALFGQNVPQRWSVAHLYQALLEDEPHLSRLSRLTTLAGWVHLHLTGEHVLGVGDASGMFPIDTSTGGYDQLLLDRFQQLERVRARGIDLRELLPSVLPAGRVAGRLTADGAALLDPRGRLEPGTPTCPPEGDAGTGMVATNTVAPRTGNISVGTSVFLMAVLEEPLREVRDEVDLVTTPAGAPVAMVHCNNGASEIDAWVTLFGQLAAALGTSATRDEVFAAVLEQARHADPGAGGLVAYNYSLGEPVVGLSDGRPLLLRRPDSQLSLPNLAQAQVYSVYATLAIGLRALVSQGVQLDVVVAHGGLFRTPGVAQQLLASSLGVPVVVDSDAQDGGAWGIALLACYLAESATSSLADWLDRSVFGDATRVAASPDPQDASGFAQYLRAFESGLAIQHVAVDSTIT